MFRALWLFFFLAWSTLHAEPFSDLSDLDDPASSKIENRTSFKKVNNLSSFLPTEDNKDQNEKFSLSEKKGATTNNATDLKEEKTPISEYKELREALKKKNKSTPKPPKPDNSEADKLLDFSEEDFSGKAGAINSNSSSIMMIFAIATALGFLFLLYWYQKHMKQKLNSAGVPISVIGQQFIDGNTRIMLVKVGPKVITLAKSNQFCTPIDIITDPDEVNFLTLSSGISAEGSNFKRTLKNEMGRKGAKNIPHSSEMKQELEDIKRQLGNM